MTRPLGRGLLASIGEAVPTAAISMSSETQPIRPRRGTPPCALRHGRVPGTGMSSEPRTWCTVNVGSGRVYRYGMIIHGWIVEKLPFHGLSAS